MKVKCLIKIRLEVYVPPFVYIYSALFGMIRKIYFLAFEYVNSTVSSRMRA